MPKFSDYMVDTQIAQDAAGSDDQSVTKGDASADKGAANASSNDDAKRSPNTSPNSTATKTSLTSEQESSAESAKMAEATPMADSSPPVINTKKVATPDEIFNDLCAAVKSYMPAADLTPLRKAYDFGAKCHSTQMRQSGEPYISHPLSVALILTELKVDLASLVAAILHDVVEDTAVCLEEIESTFGKTVAELVDGMTKIGKIQFRSNQERLAENFRKMVFAMAKDLRVILIKLADRLHNMRTLKALPASKRTRIAQETLDIYAPLANRLGIYGIKSELEDLSLRQLKREIYQELKDKVSEKKNARIAYIEDVKSILEQELKKYGFTNVTVYGRPKHFYSIYKKMTERHLEFEDVHDLFAFRIIVDSIKDCYEALGVVHAMWKPMPGRFKDYIAMPKANLYQSLHTTVIRPNGEPAEIQIRTHAMHEICEFGIAAHWAYKEKSGQQQQGVSPSSADLKKMAWLRQIMEWQTELKDPDEFLEAVKVDLFEDEIFVFTPKGDVIQLPTNATALDFAFAVHTQVGFKTVGAKVNGRIVPLKRTLQSGDIVEVQTSPNQKPSKDWLNFVTTSKAKNKIRSDLRSDQRDRSRVLGRELLIQGLEARGYDFERFEREGYVDELIKFAKESNFEDVLVSIGYGKIDARELLVRIIPERDQKIIADRLAAEALVNSTEAKVSRSSSKGPGHGILVSGINNVLVNFGRCCNPLPGEEIQGFITRGRGVTIHRASCARALDMDPHRRVQVSWAMAEPAQNEHHAFLKVITHDRPGVLADITAAIAACNANILRAQVHVSDGDMKGHLDFDLSLKSLSQLQAIIQRLESLPSVVNVERKTAVRQSKTSRRAK